MVDAGGFLSKRACSFFEGETVLRARVDSNSSWDEAHRTSVMLDEEADAVTYYECSCKPSHAGDSPCDHVIALLLDFCDDPERYEGYDTRDHLTTSHGITRLMEQASPVAASMSSDAPTELEAGTVRLEATLAYEVGFSVRFRIQGSKGAYALKSIEEFVARVEDRAFAPYGKHLAFEHVERSFSPSTWRVVEFLVRAVQNRRAYARERLLARPMRGVTSGTTQREMALSAPELWELLSLYEEGGLLFEDRSTPAAGLEAPHAVCVCDKDPSVNIDIVSLDEEGFELRRLSSVRIVSAGGRALAWDEDTLYRCSERIGANVGLLSALLSDASERMVVADKDAPQFCVTVLRRLQTCADVRIDKRLRDLWPEPCKLEFYLDYDVRRSLVSCDARATYGGTSLPLIPSAQTRGQVSANVVRDAHTEARGREVVRRYFVLRDGKGVAQVTGEDLGALVYEGVAALQEVGTVFAFPSFERLRNKARPKVRVGLSVRSRLLELDFKLEELPQEELAGLIESYRRKRAYHQLSDGSVVRMADADVAYAGRLADELDLEAHELQKPQVVPAYRAFMLDAVTSGEGKDTSFESYVARVRHRDADEWDVPGGLANVLRPYQKEGFRWLCGLASMGLGGILADEMGLGKSLQLIACLLAQQDAAREVGPSLVVCPSSLVYNWEAEFRKFAPELAVRVVAGTPQEREQIRSCSNVDVFVTSYDLLRRDIDAYEEKRLWCVALDEAQYIKNPTTQSAQAVKRLRAQNHVALTGTPVENRLSELWSIFDFLMPGLLGSYERFRERFERPIVEDEDTRVAERLRDALRPFILRRTKRDVAKDLPEKIEQVVRTHMADEQRRLYDAQLQEVRSQVSATDDPFGRGRFQILALLTRLRQICCDPELLYDGYDAGSCKTEAIMTLVERVVDAGEKMLIFSQFTSYLSILAARLEQRGVAFYTITGETSSARRLELVNAFNADDTPVFLISLKAGGTGLNLTGATVVVHADPWWNAAAQNQATDRAHRIGQTREVTVYKVIASHSIEERILELQRTKAELADAVVQGDVSSVSLSSLTREDLEDLLGE